MSLDPATVKKVANLARLALDEKQLDFYGNHMNNILKFIDQLNEVDTEGVEPLSNVSDIALRLRDDVVNDGNKQQDILANAPEQTSGFFVVGKIVE
ncbi:MAG: Asp-tRNA(Asn)/Glu-tRNA(Gln) amidotransferase subunit GatC [Alphaproteobacteria bacterium]|nr:Asp-tRNA(Asn)/Glu-tRNA(Gln) amidotransferase subunit GatC [Alphaproteobacteria bacterium]